MDETEVTPVQTEQPNATTNSGETPKENPAESSLNVEALDVVGYEKLLKELDVSKQEQPAEVEAKAEEVKEETVPEEPKKEEATKEKEPEATEETEDPSKLPERVRIGNWSEVERKAIALRARNPDMSLDEALAKIKGNEPEKAEETKQSVPSLDEVEAQVAKVKADRKQALKDLDFEKLGDLDETLDGLREKQAQLRESAKEAEVEARASYQRSVEDSKRKAVSFYPDTTDKQSQLVRRMVEIDNALKEQDNPLYYSADKPFKIAQMAGNDLGIAPKDPSRKVEKVVTPAPSSASRKAIQTPPIASGNARSNGSGIKSLETVLDGISDEEAFRSLIGKI
jgi:hypothetical protein